MKSLLRKIALIVLGVSLFSICASAQFKEDAFTQTYADPSDTLGRDSTYTMFSLKNYFRGIAHKEDLKIGTMTVGSTVFVGGSQIHNKDYWKLPVIYGGIGATGGLGAYYLNQYNKTGNIHDKRMGTCMLAGAGLIWWGSLMDGAVNYEKDLYPQPGKATVYAVLCPGLGQVYNGEYWKIPIYWSGLIGSAHFYSVNKKNYLRFQRIYREATSGDGTYNMPISAETALYYRNVYRRYRDYSVVAFAAFYLLQAIDANVFAYMQDFQVTDDLSMSVSPAILNTDEQFACNPTGFGLSLGFRF